MLSPALAVEHGKVGSLKVDEYLQVCGASGVYAAGDNAHFEDPRTQKAAPLLAQAAVAEGKAVAGNLLRAIEGRPQVPFSYRSRGNVVALGRLSGAAELRGVMAGGFLSWLAWRGIHLVMITSFRNKPATLLDWSRGYRYNRDTVRLEVEPLRLAAQTERSGSGVEKQQPFLEISEQDWDRVIATDLKGPFLCSQVAARAMVQRGEGGTIINISSVHEDLAFPGYAAYCAAKGGLRMLCRDLALELATQQINVVNVAPGAIATPINEETLQSPDKMAALKKEIPLGRVERSEEVGRLVAYLASADAAYITGTTVVIDGGLMRQTGSL